MQGFFTQRSPTSGWRSVGDEPCGLRKASRIRSGSVYTPKLMMRIYRDNRKKEDRHVRF